MSCKKKEEARRFPMPSSQRRQDVAGKEMSDRWDHDWELAIGARIRILLPCVVIIISWTFNNFNMREWSDPGTDVCTLQSRRKHSKSKFCKTTPSNDQHLTPPSRLLGRAFLSIDCDQSKQYLKLKRIVFNSIAHFQWNVSSLAPPLSFCCLRSRAHLAVSNSLLHCIPSMVARQYN
jgi:hypothetical protein